MSWWVCQDADVEQNTTPIHSQQRLSHIWIVNRLPGVAPCLVPWPGSIRLPVEIALPKDSFLPAATGVNREMSVFLTKSPSDGRTSLATQYDRGGKH